MEIIFLVGGQSSRRNQGKNLCTEHNSRYYRNSKTVLPVAYHDGISSFTEKKLKAIKRPAINSDTKQTNDLLVV